MPEYADRCKDTTTSTGTGNLTLSGTAPTGFVAFATAYATTDQIPYFIEGVGAVASEWEVGIGHLSASTTFVRDTVLHSSNADALVNLSAGTHNVVATLPADHIADQGLVQAFAACIVTP